jgi:hypothetical protein
MNEPADRRAEERFAISSDTFCTFVSPVLEDFGPAKIKNISLEGIGLVVAHRVEPGSLLAVNLLNPVRGFVKVVLVRVVHTTAVQAGYLVGGTFSSPLTYQELTTLVL